MNGRIQLGSAIISGPAKRTVGRRARIVIENFRHSAKKASKIGLLANVPTLNFHPHLPHYEITDKNSKSVQLLARQPIDLDRPHPFTAAGNTEFNCLLCMAPNEQRAGDIVLVDSTNFTTLFGGTDSLQNFWRNLALMK